MSSLLSSWRGLIWPLFVPGFLMTLLLGVVQPVLPLYLERGGASLAVIGTVISARAFGGLIFGLPGSGILSRYSMRRTTMAGLGVVVVSLVLMGLTASPAGLFALWLIVGMGLSLYEIGRHQYIATTINPAARGRTVSVLGGINRLSRTVGPAVGGAIAARFGFQMPFWVMAGLALLATVILYFSLPEISEPGGGAAFSLQTYWEELKETAYLYRRIIIAGGAGQLIMQMVRQARDVIIPLFAAVQLGLDVAEVGFILSIGSAVDTSLFWSSGIIMDRFGRKAAIIPGLIFQLFGFLALPLTWSFGSLAVVAGFLGLGNGVTSGTMLTLGADLAPPGRRVPFLGIWRLSSSLGFTLGPNAVGIAAELLSLAAASWTISGLALAGIVVFGSFVPETLQRQAVKN